MVELTQKHGSPPYSQGRAMEELLAHQTRKNNLTAAAETIKAGNSQTSEENMSLLWLTSRQYLPHS